MLNIVSENKGWSTNSSSHSRLMNALLKDSDKWDFDLFDLKINPNYVYHKRIFFNTSVINEKSKYSQKTQNLPIDIYINDNSEDHENLLFSYKKTENLNLLNDIYKFLSKYLISDEYVSIQDFKEYILNKATKTNKKNIFDILYRNELSSDFDNYDNIHNLNISDELQDILYYIETQEEKGSNSDNWTIKYDNRFLISYEVAIRIEKQCSYIKDLTEDILDQIIKDHQSSSVYMCHEEQITIDTFFDIEAFKYLFCQKFSKQLKSIMKNSKTSVTYLSFIEDIEQKVKDDIYHHLFKFIKNKYLDQSSTYHTALQVNYYNEKDEEINLNEITIENIESKFENFYFEFTTENDLEDNNLGEYVIISSWELSSS